MTIQLSPKDPDPYPNFRINRVQDAVVEFLKSSNQNLVTIDLRKIAEITVNQAEQLAYIRVLGRIAWHADIEGWKFEPTGPVGRPLKLSGVRASIRTR